MRIKTKINSFLSLAMAGLLSIFGGKRVIPTSEDFERMEFKSSMQRLGVRFSEKIRDVFRFKWVRKS